MQDRTINNALLALRKAGGTEGKLAEVLLDIRKVPLPCWYQDRPFKRGDTQRLIMAALRDGPKTNSDLGRLIQNSRPDIAHKAAANRTYQCLLRLEAKGLARRLGREWMLAP